tara:strand:+ start:759 stop:926 length:168 start_codon:yes stop_codon:yes gene_type:complete
MTNSNTFDCAEGMIRHRIADEGWTASEATKEAFNVLVLTATEQMRLNEIAERLES